MSGTTSATGPEGPELRAGIGPEHRAGPGPERGPVTVAEAARVLGISERAVRKRIQVGTLKASPVGRSYDVWLPALHGPGPEQDRPTSGPGSAPAEPITGSTGPASGGSSGPSGPGPEPIEAAFRSSSGAVVSAAARVQLAAIRDEWLAPLVERTGALERENGDLAGQLAARAEVLAAKDETIAELRRRAEAAEGERLAAEGERDALRLQLAEVAVPPVVVVAAQEAAETPHTTERPPRRTGPHRGSGGVCGAGWPGGEGRRRRSRGILLPDRGRRRKSMGKHALSDLRRYLVAPLLLLLLALPTLRALGARGLRPLATWRGAARHALALMYAFTASAHFTRRREDLVRMVPPWVPTPRRVVLVTGALELLGTAGLLVPATAPLAGRGLAALLAALFPANVHAARQGVALGGKPATPLGFRALVQGLFIALTLWASNALPQDRRTRESGSADRP